MTPSQWNIALAPSVAWQSAYADVEKQARAHLTANPCIDDGCSTEELVEALYPLRLAQGDGILARRRIYKALAALATRGLADCATRGAPRNLGKTKNTKIRPWLWHEPREKNPESKGNICPHCGGAL